jgi:hypothetical protein
MKTPKQIVAEYREWKAYEREVEAGRKDRRRAWRMGYRRPRSYFDAGAWWHIRRENRNYYRAIVTRILFAVALAALLIAALICFGPDKPLF